ncbi:MAG: hypothetical protein KDA68_00100 [Planctomycetaceae bacterium]|nr:hypothetical protein [Planctomycetaceae bacterium]
MFRRTLIIGLFALLFAGLPAREVYACPSCREANSTHKNLPLAYQTSILFMLSVPMMIFSGFGIGLYRLNKAQEAAVAEFENGDAWSEDPSFEPPHEPDVS